MAAQQAGDFKPLDDALPETGPTLACSLLAPLLAALGKAAALHLHAANAESVSAEVGSPAALHATSWGRQPMLQAPQSLDCCRAPTSGAGGWSRGWS